MDRCEKALYDLLAAARNGAETLSKDGRPENRKEDSDALWRACEPFLAAARMRPPTAFAQSVLEIFGED